LHNAPHVVRRGKGALVIAGIPDHDGASFGAPTHLDRTFANAPEEAPRVLLAHQPRSARLTQQHNVALQLSGHTHGGQFFPWMFFVKLQQPVLAGLHRLGTGWLYTSRGTGYWGPPIRLGAPPEITELTLTRA
ncbi:MAG: metallophosphoesterase, partial [Myxococcaceae bacterium]